MHTFRELVLGAYLASSGLNVRYEYRVGTHTPDWCVLDESSSLKAIVELTNFHLDKVTEDDITAKLQTTGIGLQWQAPNDDRLYHAIQRKADKYKAVAESFSVPYAVAVFGEFNAAVNLDELNQCLFHRETGLFGLYPVVAGVLFFEGQSGRYSFKYIPNPNALRRVRIPNGEFA